MELSEKKILQDGDITKDDEELIFNPFNDVNKEITLSEVQSILSKYGISANIYNKELYSRAFVHRSYTKRPSLENEESNITIAPRPKNCLPLKSKSNERLEFVGDGVLELITKYYLYRRFPKADEGFMTEKKIALVKNEHIGKVAYEMGLHKWLILSKHAEEKQTRTNLKKLGCLFESFLGALFLDFNKIKVYDENEWFQNVFVTGPGFQMAQIFVEITPDYLEIEHDVENGYTMGVFLCIGKPIHQQNISDAIPIERFGKFTDIQSHLLQNDSVFIFLSSGTHKIKKKSEQIACEKIIKYLET